MSSTLQSRPIGIFDSGIGGLTVAAAIQRLMPSEMLVYFGDTAHLPYGDKSPDLVRTYATRITHELLRLRDCKTIVIACNTASAVAYEALRDSFLGVVPIINVIDPMVEAIIGEPDIKKVGIIGTKTTISSGVYQEKLSRRKPSLKFAALPTPLLAGMIEEGFYNDNISHAVLQEYLGAPSLEGIDTLVLACTHYPLIKKEISAFYNGKVRVLDSAEVVAKKLKDILTKEKMEAQEKTGPNHFYVSDLTESFSRTTRLFYGSSIHLELKKIWNEEY